MSNQVESGYEADRLRTTRAGAYRWWLYVQIEGKHLRDQRARKGVVDHGFRFARGGRTYTVADAIAAIREAERQAVAECRSWQGQPSHALGPRGELIPLDRVETLDDLRELAR